MAQLTYQDIYKAHKIALQSGETQDAATLRSKIPQEVFNQLQAQDQIAAMREYSMRQQVNEMGPVDNFLTAAGIQSNRMMSGAADLLGVGDRQAEQARAEEQRQYNMAANMMSENRPVGTFAGEAFGGIATTLPVAAALPEVSGAGALATGGRYLGNMLLGGIEGFVEYPQEGATRGANAAAGAVFALGAEALTSKLGNALAKWRHSRIPGALDDQSTNDALATALQEQGIDISQLNPETRQYLSNLNRNVDIDRAVEEAVQLEYGIRLTAGEATGDYAQLSAEETAARMSGEAGARLREFKVEQNRGIIAAAEDIAEGAGGATFSPAAAGESIKNALLQVRTNDKNAYDALYDSLRELADQSEVQLPLDTSQVENTFRQMVSDHGSQYETMLMDIGRKLSQYGVLDPEQFRSSKLLEIADVDYGPLSASNSQDMIKYLNSLWNNNDPVGNRIIQQIKASIDDSNNALLDMFGDIPEDKLLEMGLNPQVVGDFLQTAQRARGAFSEYKGLWEARDVLQNLVDVRAGTDTPITDPSSVVKRIMSSPENINRVLDVLRNNGQNQAIADLRTYVLKDIFDGAINPNALNAGMEAMFSGAKLSTALSKNEQLLGALLTPSQLTQLRAFEELVTKATKRPVGTVNHSGTAYKMMDFFFNTLGLNKIPLISVVPETVARRTVNNATAGAPSEIAGALRLNDGHNKLNAVMRQLMNVTEDRVTEEDDPRQQGILVE